MAGQFYLSINTRPREVLRVMDHVTQDLGRYRVEQRGAWLMAAGLGVAGLSFWIVDHKMAYSGSAFAFVAYLLWGGAALLLAYTLVTMLIRWPHILRSIGSCVLVAIFILIFPLMAWWGGVMSGQAFLILLGVGIIVLIIYASEQATRLPQDQMETARQILHTLRDDVGREGRVTGWLDLTGSRQKSKLLRTGRSSSGNVKYYYRDPWLSTKIQLVDGNLLRLTLIERVKVKKGAVVGRRHQLKAKLVVNPQVYDIGSGQPLPGLTLDGSIFQLQASRSRPFTAKGILSILKGMYSHLQPRQPAA